jgi:hypothetical protein
MKIKTIPPDSTLKKVFMQLASTENIAKDKASIF